MSRLDQLLVEKGFFPSREKAQRAIMAGQVRVNGHLCDKASHKTAPDALVEILGGEKYVGRGGLKLEAALHHFSIQPSGLHCLDIGASTGGFTDCLLQHGASHVVALDVGHGQLDWKIRSDPRVTPVEKMNARHLKPSDFDRLFDLIVADVSFISLKTILPPAFDLLAPGGRICALIKPQFEAGREEIGKGGIVRDEKIRLRILDEMIQWIRGFPHMTSFGTLPSPITGTDGNQEYLWCMRQDPSGK